MLPRSRSGVAGYLEVFILIGIAVFGSGIVFGAASAYTSALQGPSVLVPSATIRQGAYLAVESVTVFNSGQASVTSFTISTPQASSSSSYCYSVLNPSTMAVITSSCPTMTANPRAVTVTSPFAPASAVLVELTIVGQAFTLGSSVLVTVTTSAGAQQSLSLQAVPA